MTRKICSFCGKWFDKNLMTPLYEKGKDFTSWYCERCIPEVKMNINSLPWKHLYTFEEKVGK